MYGSRPGEYDHVAAMTHWPETPEKKARGKRYWDRLVACVPLDLCKKLILETMARRRVVAADEVMVPADYEKQSLLAEIDRDKYLSEEAKNADRGLAELFAGWAGKKFSEIVKPDPAEDEEEAAEKLQWVPFHLVVQWMEYLATVRMLRHNAELGEPVRLTDELLPISPPSTFDKFLEDYPTWHDMFAHSVMNALDHEDAKKLVAVVAGEMRKLIEAHPDGLDLNEYTDYDMTFKIIVAHDERGYYLAPLTATLQPTGGANWD